LYISIPIHAFLYKFSLCRSGHYHSAHGEDARGQPKLSHLGFSSFQCRLCTSLVDRKTPCGRSSRPTKLRYTNLALDIYISASCKWSQVATMSTYIPLRQSMMELKSESNALVERTRQNRRSMITRIGLFSVCALVIGTILISGVFGFLSFLWWSNSSNEIWRQIVVDGWATRSVTVASHVIRTCVCLHGYAGSARLALGRGSSIRHGCCLALPLLQCGTFLPYSTPI